MSRSNPDYWKQYRARNKEKIRAYLDRPEVKQRVQSNFRKWCLNNLNKRRASGAKYRASHKVIITIRNKSYAAKNGESLAEKAKIYYSKNKENISGKNRIYHKKRYQEDSAYREKILKQSRAWGIKNPDKRRQSIRDYCRRNPEVYLAKTQKYRAIKKGATIVSSESNQFIIHLKSLLNPKCYYCLLPIPDKKRHIDHKTPLSRGGLHIPENLCLSCEHCNCVKSDRTESEFRNILLDESERKMVITA